MQNSKISHTCFNFAFSPTISQEFKISLRVQQEFTFYWLATIENS